MPNGPESAAPFRRSPVRILDARVTVETFATGYRTPELLDLEPGTRLLVDSRTHAVDADTGANYTVHGGCWPTIALLTEAEWSEAQS